MPNFILIIILFILVTLNPADAYIGPGAGFVFVSSFLIFIVTFLLAFLVVLSYPFRRILIYIRQKKIKRKFNQKKVVVLGFDGIDPKITEDLISRGLLPNMKKLKETGKFCKLKTTLPSISPVAWSSFATGVNPGKHNIFDFLTSSRKNYIAELSSVYMGSPKKHINIGKYRIPLGKPDIRLLRKSKSFWKILGEHGIFSSILRVPITFPPEKFYGHQLSAMCVPDLRGTQGTFSYYTSDEKINTENTGGETFIVKPENNMIQSKIIGPPASILKNHGSMEVPFSLLLNGDETALLQISGKNVTLRKNCFSDWIDMEFTAGLNIKVAGICRFFLKEIRPNLKLYVTPVNIAPGKPAMPVSHPFVYAAYLKNLIDNYATLGLAEDTWALNERITDEKIFLEQCYSIQEEREKMFYNTLKKQESGIISCVFDSTDRIQHMFWRYLEEDHPSNRDKENTEYKKAIEDIYIRSDNVVGETLKYLNENDILFIMSDHGFTSFQRGVNLNTWLYKNGFLNLKDENAENGDWFTNVDWSKTKAYSLGLTGIYLNVKGRERDGILEKNDIKKTKQELINKLEGLKDEKTGEPAILKAYDSGSALKGPYTDNAPEIIIGFNRKYRSSWENAVGKITEDIFCDNIKSWTGDHSVEPNLVPGVLICNRNFEKEKPEIIDLAPTILDLFGIDKPGFIDGETIFK